MTIEILRNNAINFINDYWKKHEDINGLINNKRKKKVLGKNWQGKINSLKERTDINEARDSLIDLINWEMPVIIENPDEEIDYTNETEFGQDVNENFKKYNGKRLIFRNCTKLKRIEVDCLGLIGLEIENCPELEYLSAYHNEIKELDFMGCKKLKTIYVPFNHRLNKKGERKIALEVINIKDCQELESLNVSSCNLTELDLTNNAKLKSLSCDNTFIRELNIKHLSRLEFLHCFRCLLDKLDCSGLKKLKDLNCHGNASVDYTFRSKAKIKKSNFLQQLEIPGAKTTEGMEKLNVRGCDGLEELDCAENSLRRLDFSNLKNLKFVSAKENSLERLNIINCYNLNFIDFSDQTSFFWDCDIDTFFKINAGSQNLRKLFCSKGTDFFDLETKKKVDWKYFYKLQLLEIGENKEIEVKDESGEVYNVRKYFLERNPEFERLLKIRRKISTRKITNWWKKYHKSKESPPRNDEGYSSDEERVEQTPRPEIPEYKTDNENQHWLDKWLELQALKDKKKLTELEKYKDELKFLDLSWQKLKGEIVIENFPRLKSLNLGNNLLNKVIVKNCPKLKKLIVSHNPLNGGIEKDNCSELTQIFQFGDEEIINLSENIELGAKTVEELEKDIEELRENIELKDEHNDKIRSILERNKNGEDISLDELAQLLDEIKNPNLIDPEYLHKFIALYHSKSKELFHEQFKKQEEWEQESEREKKTLQKIAGLIIEAQQFLKEGNLPELARVLEEMEKHCNTSSYADNKQVITNLKEQLSKLTSSQEAFVSPDKPANYHLIVLLLVGGVLVLIFLAKFLQTKLKKMVKFK